MTPTEMVAWAPSLPQPPDLCPAPKPNQNAIISLGDAVDAPSLQVSLEAK